MAWNLVVVKSAEKQLKKIPKEDAGRIRRALVEMQDTPFAGDIVYLKGEQNVLRRRIGNWRIIFEVLTEQKTIIIEAILRRTSTTY